MIVKLRTSRDSFPTLPSPLSSPRHNSVLVRGKISSGSGLTFYITASGPPHPLPNIAALDCTLLCLITFNYFYQYNDFFSMVLTALSSVPCPETEGELRIEIRLSCCGRR